MRVYSDSFEYREWPSRKPSKKKIAREAFKTDPLGTTGSITQTAAKKSIEKLGERTATKLARTVRTGAVPAVLGGARALAPYAIPAAAAAGTVAAAVVGFVALARAENRLARERITQLSHDFVAAQQQVMQQFNTRNWNDVPIELRNKLLNGYKKALSEVQVYAPGVLRPSQQIPYGR